MSSLVWKLNRLRAMGVAEVLYRVRQGVQAKLESRGVGIRPAPPVVSDRIGQPWLDAMPRQFDIDRYRYAANAILAGRYDVFAMRGTELGFPPRWNRDPETGTEAPLQFGKTLNYRDERRVGNIKYLWEPNRHLELVTLAQAWHLSRELVYSEGCRTLLESWFEQCPYPYGANWTSSLEVAIRMLNWSVAWHLLEGGQSELFAGTSGSTFRRRWLESIYHHCKFISGHLSRYSSANNHLFGEYMGLLVGSLTWPCWPESSAWVELARQGIEEEAQKQNAPDGVNREQAVWYHHEVADMMLLCGLIGRVNGVEFSRAYWSRLENMLEFVASIMDVVGNVPMIGDSDDAVMVRFSQEQQFNVFRSLLATGAVLFKRADFMAKASRFDDKSRWLLGDGASAKFAALPARLPATPMRKHYPDGGYWVLGVSFEAPEEIRLVVDAAPLGFLSIAAHGHADALSLALSVGGNPVLIDPGTYAYHTEKKWRDYFRGTAAHNTVRVDGVDQSVSGGNFLWLRHAKARCLLFESTPERDVWAGEHDGYQRLADPVAHRRDITLDKVRQIIQIDDQLACRAGHYVEIHWHVSPECEVIAQGDDVVISSGRDIVILSTSGSDWHPQLVTGRDDPPLGWVSPGFGEKRPTTCIRWAGDISGSTRFSTTIQINPKNRTAP